MGGFRTDKLERFHKTQRELILNKRVAVPGVLYVARCANCGFEKRIPPSKAKRNKNNFCSKSCETEFREQHPNKVKR